MDAAAEIAAGRTVTYVDAIRLALAYEMAADPSVFLLGEDIGRYGGAFKATRGLYDAFGASRVVDTPISESLIVGAAIGAAIRGLKPVAEMQFADFLTCGFSQLVQNAATFHYRIGQAVPMVLRLPSGGGIGGGPFHSRNLEAWLAHAPGLKVVAPTTAEDAYGLLRAAIRDPDPVMFLEQKYLYRREKGVIPSAEHMVPLGQAAVRRQGTKATVLTYANMVRPSLEAADHIATRRVQVEVIDLRSLVPMDWDTIVESVRRTARVLIVHEDTRTAGIGAELAATIADVCFEYLDAPVQRVTAPDVPVPAEANLEAWFRPDSRRIHQALVDLCDW